jgi:hypothetical protein
MYSKCSLKLNKECCRTEMLTLEKRRGRPRDRSRFILKQTFAKRASDFKSFEDLPEHLQLKIFEMARLPGPCEEDLRTGMMLRAVSRNFKRMIDFAEGFGLKQIFAHRASESKSFEVLPEILQLKIFDCKGARAAYSDVGGRFAYPHCASGG